MADQLPSQEIYRGKRVTLKLEDVPQPIGGTTRFEIVEHPDAVAIVAASYDAAAGPTAGPRILLVRQPRPAHVRWVSLITILSPWPPESGC